MIIESPVNLSINPPPSENYRWPIILGTITTLSATVLPLIFIILPVNRPTGSLLSPLPQGEVASAQTTPASLNFSETVNLAQNYLNKAYEQARNQNQTEDDKKAIFSSLNESLKQATAAINLSPDNPAGYLLRAQVFTAISKVNPEAVAYAKQDLDIAEQLSSGKDVSLPPATNPINLLPEEQAAAAESLLIASSEEEASTASGKLDTQTSASQKRVILPADQAETVIKDPLVKADSYIYLIPITVTNNPIYVKTKTAGSFTIATTSSNNASQAIDYYVINATDSP